VQDDEEQDPFQDRSHRAAIPDEAADVDTTPPFQTLVGYSTSVSDNLRPLSDDVPLRTDKSVARFAVSANSVNESHLIRPSEGRTRKHAHRYYFRCFVTALCTVYAKPRRCISGHTINLYCDME
jgi:hypothetical protein